MTDRDPWTCPRCGRTVTDYPGRSRTDNQSPVCSACDTDESLLDYADKRLPEPSEWPVTR